ncbi:metal-dependent hydrolase [Thermococcus waiotapuensis]|uniref:Metal-dependent hydrolase n=1 Tax=Thermococcus waiotapuensis TaxID=90909 RepID=A0AAE4T3F9_9EURY|nr:metal-dependent hydrolase [Thermococcus waiotapuensis]MDV3103778.1 metal-dependent hydrolase [Thermococcus waiotapuensis]
MPNYDAHLLSGILTYPLAVALAGILKEYSGIPFEFSSIALILGYALYVLGSDLPDMDHPDALLHRGTKPIVAVAVGSAVYLQALHWFSFSEEWLNQTAAWGVGVVGALSGWFGFTWLMPRHRGVVHSLLFAAVYGLLAYLLGTFGLRMTGGESLYLSIAAFLGYTLHLLLDGSLKLL